MKWISILVSIAWYLSER